MNLGQGDVGHARTAVGLGHADAPQARAGKHVQFGQWQAAFAVALGAVAAQVFSKIAGDNKRLFVAGDDRDGVRKGHGFLQKLVEKCSGWLNPGMTSRQGAVEPIGADGVVLPAHRVVQGVHPGVAPVTVKVEFGQGGAAAGQFKELLGDL